MAKRGGFPGGGMPGNMSNLMKQAQRMQRQMEEGQKELEAKEFSATSGGGAVEVTINGKKEVLKRWLWRALRQTKAKYKKLAPLWKGSKLQPNWLEKLKLRWRKF